MFVFVHNKIGEVSTRPSDAPHKKSGPPSMPPPPAPIETEQQVIPSVDAYTAEIAAAAAAAAAQHWSRSPVSAKIFAKTAESVSEKSSAVTPNSVSPSTTRAPAETSASAASSIPHPFQRVLDMGGYDRTTPPGLTFKESLPKRESDIFADQMRHQRQSQIVAREQMVANGIPIDKLSRPVLPKFPSDLKSDLKGRQDQFVHSPIFVIHFTGIDIRGGFERFSDDVDKIPRGYGMLFAGPHLVALEAGMKNLSNFCRELPKIFEKDDQIDLGKIKLSVSAPPNSNNEVGGREMALLIYRNLCLLERSASSSLDFAKQAEAAATAAMQQAEAVASSSASASASIAPSQFLHSEGSSPGEKAVTPITSTEQFDKIFGEKWYEMERKKIEADMAALRQKNIERDLLLGQLQQGMPRPGAPQNPPLLAGNMVFDLLFAQPDPGDVLRTNAGSPGPLIALRVQKLLLGQLFRGMGLCASEEANKYGLLVHDGFFVVGRWEDTDKIIEYFKMVRNLTRKPSRPRIRVVETEKFEATLGPHATEILLNRIKVVHQKLAAGVQHFPEPTHPLNKNLTIGEQIFDSRNKFSQFNSAN